MKLNFTRFALPAIVLLVVFSSCQKEVGFEDGIQSPGTGNSAAIKGEWKFTSQSAKTRVSVEIKDAGQNFRSVTESNYVTENNAGTLKITDNQFIFTGITNSVNAIAHSKTYINGLLIDENDLPFSATTPPTNYTYDYVRNAGDSITFSNAGFIVPSAPGSTQTSTGPLGAHVTVVGDVLTIKVVTKINTPFDQGGSTGNLTSDLEGVLSFKK